MSILIGADPEFFVRRNGHFISAHIFNCGTKKKPEATAHGFVQVDGMALEANVRPSKTEHEFLANLRGIQSDLEHIVDGHPWITKGKLCSVPTAVFGKHEWDQTPDEAKKLGCEPDFNAYTLKMNPRPSTDAPFRTGAGHIHIGFTENANPMSRNHINQCAALVRELDFFLGLPSLLWDTDNQRRTLYGKAGAFRPKTYGVEYRTLSNAWTSQEMKGADNLVRWIFRRTMAAVANWQKNSMMSTRFQDRAKNLIDMNVQKWPQYNEEIAKEVLVR